MPVREKNLSQPILSIHSPVALARGRHRLAQRIHVVAQALEVVDHVAACLAGIAPAERARRVERALVEAEGRLQRGDHLGTAGVTRETVDVCDCQGTPSKDALHALGVKTGTYVIQDGSVAAIRGPHPQFEGQTFCSALLP